MSKNKTTTLEILDEGETVFGSIPAGRYWVQEYIDGQPTGGQFFETLKDASEHIQKFTNDDKPELLTENTIYMDDIR
jgi:hypothetical protein|tara:strand:- start:350 stop:580 length:231 start_codon:yes stop_codon:yes gene_type:complete